MSGSSPGRALAATAPSFEVVFIDETGTQRREPLSACWDVPFERAKPSRSFPSFKGQKNFPGLWWSVTMGEHVGYESWVERDVAMLLDFDPEIVGFSAQPFWSGCYGLANGVSASTRRTSSLGGRTGLAW